MRQYYALPRTAVPFDSCSAVCHVIDEVMNCEPLHGNVSSIAANTDSYCASLGGVMVEISFYHSIGFYSIAEIGRYGVTP